jgi:hypothetical protein
MSTILKALKKLEQEHEERQINSASAIHKLDVKQTIQKRMKPKRLPSFCLGGLWIAILIIFAGTIGYFVVDNSIKVKSVQTASRKNEIHALPEKKTNIQSPIKSDDGIKHEIKVRNQKAESETTGKPRMKADVAPVRENPPTTTKATDAFVKLNEKQNSNNVVTPPVPKTDSAQSPPAARAPIQPPSQEASQEIFVPAEKQESASIPRLTDGRLRIQAIAWASAAQDRMAVINNRVVREGYAVDGFSIENIGENEVVVREGETRWKVVFGQP